MIIAVKVLLIILAILAILVIILASLGFYKANEAISLLFSNWGRMG